MKKAEMKSKRTHAKRRAHRVRSRLHGTAACPRLSVKRSLRHIYAQMIDDDAGRTLSAASDADVKETGKPVETAKKVGKIIGERAKEKGISQAVFDRGAYRYHGRVAALADGAREAGLSF